MAVAGEVRAMAETNEYWQSIPTQEALEQRIFETRQVWYNGDIHIYSMWKSGDQICISGVSEYGFVFSRPIPADSYVAIKLK